MQSAQRKMYDPVPLPARKRTVKMRGNVAYINNDFLSSQPPQRPKRRPKPGAKARLVKAQPKQGAKAQSKQSIKAQPRQGAAKQPKASLKKQQAAAPVSQKKTGKGLASTFFVIFIAFCALALLVSRHATVASIGVQNNALLKDIAATEAQIDELKLELELRSTLESVQNSARQELGMTYPMQNKKVHIDLNGR